MQSLLDALRRLGPSHALVALLTAIAAAGVTIAIDDNGPGNRHVTISVGGPKTLVPADTAVDGPDADAKTDDPVQLDKPARQVAQGFATNARDLRGALRGPDSGPVAKLLPPFASDSIPGCRTRFLGTNWSYRSGGATPHGFWLHYSGGPDMPGTRAEVDGLTAFGNSPSAGVSWHLNMDKDGNCDYNVPLRYKAWTEAGANSTGISIEVAGTGSPPYLRAGGVRELRRIYDVIHRRYGIPLQLGAVADCRITRPGILTHWMGGPCSGGHTDIRPLDVRKVIGQLQAAGCNAACRVRRDHASVHKAIRDHRCAPEARSRSVNCKALYARNHALHAQARALHATL